MDSLTYKHMFWFLVSYGEELTIEIMGKAKYLKFCWEYDTTENPDIEDLVISNYKKYDFKAFPEKIRAFETGIYW